MKTRTGLGMLFSVVVCHLLVGGWVTTAYGQLVIIDQATGTNITATYLPEPGKTVVLQGGASFVLTNTTNYPGVCTNFGNNGDVGPDFTLAGNLLTSNDCGGTATITVDGTPVKVPADGNSNEIADILEAQFGGNLTPNEDIELSPSVVESPDTNLDDPDRRGDGISVFDELERGFIVSNSDPKEGVPLAGFPGFKHIRTDPVNGKDLFVHVVNGQCAPATPPLGRFDRYFPAGGPDLFSGADSLIPGRHIHLLDFAPGQINPVQTNLWVDFFSQYSVDFVTTPNGSFRGVIFQDGGIFKTTEPQTDRQINKNAVFPITDLKSGLAIQKGVRLIECQQNDSTTVLGVASWGTPNKAESIFAVYAGNVTVFPERVRQSIADKIADAGARKLRLQVYAPATAKWIDAPDSATAPLNPLNIPKNQSGEDVLTRIHLQYTVAHEIGHSTKLRPTTSLGSHSPTGSGSMMDQTIDVTYAKKATGVAKFYIPDLFQTPDVQEVKANN